MIICCPHCNSKDFDLIDLETLSLGNCLHYCCCDKCNSLFVIDYQPISITELDNED